MRAYLGDDCLGTIVQTIAINQLDNRVWVYSGLLQLVMHLAKIVTPVKGQLARVKRRYDQAHTPFDRLCETDVIAQKGRE